MRNTTIRNLLAALMLAALPMTSFAFVSVGISVDLAPPPLPVYVQPPCPAVGYIWTPGYWAYGDGDYYWVPGTWVLAPAVGLLWTPGYWGWADGGYRWHAGYWGPHVGFYGGVNYGYGYQGVGFDGGYWRGGAFYYNRAVANLGSAHITNVYNRTVINNITVNRVSFNGGAGGLTVRPTAAERLADRDRHIGVTSAQREHEHLAAGNRELRAAVNGGKPPIAATARPGAFSGRGVVAARAAGGPARVTESRAGTGVASHTGPRSGDGRPGTAEVRSHAAPNASMGARMGARNDRPPPAQRPGIPSATSRGGNSASFAEPRVAPPPGTARRGVESRPAELRTAEPRVAQPRMAEPGMQMHSPPPGRSVAAAEQPHPQGRAQPQEREHEENHPRH